MADIFDIQDEIAQAIAAALHVKLSGAPAPAQQYKPNLPAYEALLKARYYLGQFRPDLYPRVKECFEQAIVLDPKFALAHCEYGYYFFSMVIVGAMPANQAAPMMRSLAQKAIDLDPSLPDGHSMLGVAAALLEYDWREAERRFHLAMAGDSVPPTVRLAYAMSYLLATGCPADAVQQIERGLQEDPLNSALQVYRAVNLAAAGREEDATKASRETLEINPAIAPAYSLLGVLHVLRGELDQALALVEKAYSIAPSLPNNVGLLAGLLMRTGDSHRAEELLRKLQPGDAFGAPRGLAIYHWVLQEFDAEADWIEKGIDQRDPGAALMPRLWYGRELRSTPRWAGLMRKMNLPES
jgi:serine/threonine-protein kinase